MRTAPFLHGATYDPETLRILGMVFDNAWASIAANFEAGSEEAARLKLATIILQLAVDVECDPLELKCRAIGAMQLPRAA